MPDWFRRRQQLQLPAPHQQPVSIGARARHEVERQRDLAAAELARAAREGRSTHDTRWDQGIYDAARWALGELDTAPISGTYTAGIPDATALRAEDDAAFRAIRNSSYTYEVAVQHTLMWVRGLTSDSPAIEYDD